MPRVPKLRLKHYNSRSNAAPYYPLTTGLFKGAGQAPAEATNSKSTSASDKKFISPTDAASDKTMEGDLTPDSLVRQRIRDIANELPFPPIPQPNPTMRENSQRFLAHKYKEVDALINWRLGQFAVQTMRLHSNHFSKTPARLLKNCVKALMEEASIKTSPPTSPGGAHSQSAANSGVTPSNDILIVVPDGLKAVRINDLLKLVKESSNRRDEEYLDSYRARRRAFKIWREEINAAVENGELGFLDRELDAAVEEQQQRNEASAASDLALKKK